MLNTLISWKLWHFWNRAPACAANALVSLSEGCAAVPDRHAAPRQRRLRQARRRQGGPIQILARSQAATDGNCYVKHKKVCRFVMTSTQ
jgi:hypothetical protein